MQTRMLHSRPAKVGESGHRSFSSYLRAVDIFQDLTEAEMEALHSVIPVERCVQGTVFYRPGDRVERLFILKEGTVILYRLTSDGHKLAVATVGGGTIFGEMALAGQSMRDCFAEAHDDTLVCTIAQPDLEGLLRARPEVALRLLMVIGRRIQELEERLELMAYGSVRQRLARLLLGKAERRQDRYEMEGMTHEYLGEAVGAARQTVTQELRRMEDEGLVQLGRKWIRVVDVAALQSVLGENRPAL